VGYRRLSGKLAIDATATGTRGLWWEKRRAFIAALLARQHEVVWLSARMGQEQEGYATSAVDLLIVEFGGMNEQWYAKDIAETKRIVQAHDGLAIYLCDDPALSAPTWLLYDARERWHVWNNCTERIGQKHERDFPFGSLLSTLPSAIDYSGRLVYIGRAQGRTRALREAFAATDVQVYGRAGEWATWPGVTVLDAPAQPQRAAFYNAQLGCLGVADQEHMRRGWRTGRVHHAVAAGAPAAIPRGHKAFAGWRGLYGDGSELKQLVEQWRREPGARLTAVEQQQRAMVIEREQCMEAFASVGL
jgi:hypothetical protein